MSLETLNTVHGNGPRICASLGQLYAERARSELKWFA